MPAEQRAPAIATGAGRARDAATARKGSQRRDRVRSLQRTLYQAAKADRRRTFHQLFVHLLRTDVLEEAWRRVRDNGGAGGVDHVEIQEFARSSEAELHRLQTDLRKGTYRPLPVRRVEIPKTKTETRPLGIPTIRDRVVQTAIQIVLEPVVDARFYENSYGFRPKRSAHQALDWVGKLIQSGYRYVLDLDVEKFFDQVKHKTMLECVRRHVSDRRLLRLIKQILKAPILEPNGILRASRQGCPQGGPLSPVLANLYLTILDYWFVKNFWFKDAVWIRYADDGLLLSRVPLGKTRLRIRGVLRQMGLTLNERKTREVDMGAHGGTLDFLGYRFARRPSRSTQNLALLQYPSPEACARVRTRLREVIPTRGPRAPNEVVSDANLVLRGWIRYFALSHRKQPFKALGDFAKKRMRRYLMRRRGLRSQGTRRYPDRWLLDTLGLESAYHFYIRLRASRPNAFG